MAVGIRTEGLGSDLKLGEFVFPALDEHNGGKRKVAFQGDHVEPGIFFISPDHILDLARIFPREKAGHIQSFFLIPDVFPDQEQGKIASVVRQYLSPAVGDQPPGGGQIDTLDHVLIGLLTVILVLDDLNIPIDEKNTQENNHQQNGAQRK